MRSRRAVSSKTCMIMMRHGACADGICLARKVSTRYPRRWYVVDVTDGTIIFTSKSLPRATQMASIVRRDLRRDARKIELCYSSPPSPFI